MFPETPEDHEAERKRALLLRDPKALPFASRYPLPLVFIALMTISAILVGLVVAIWASSTQEEIIRKSRERSIKISRGMSADLNSISQKIVVTLGRHAPRADANVEPNKWEFQKIAADLEGHLDAHLYHLDARQVIKQASHTQDKKLLGRVFDEGPKISFSAVRPGLFISEMLPSLDFKTPLFEWRMPHHSGSYILQTSLSDFWSWCKQTAFTEHQDVLVSLASSGSNSFRADCTRHQDLDGLWNAFQKTRLNDPLSPLVAFKSSAYVVSTHRPDTFPVSVTVFMRVPSKKELLSDHSALMYTLLLIPLCLCLFVFSLFKYRIDEHVSRISWLASTLPKHPGQEIDYPKHSQEFGPAFSDLRSMYEALDQSQVKNAIKTKLSMELASLYHTDECLGKATEILGSQTRADACFFLPNRAVQDKYPIKGWSWALQIMKEILPTDESQIRSEIASHHLFRIPARHDSKILGDFYLVSPKLKDQTILDLAPALIGIIESNLTKNQTLWREAIKDLENMTAKFLTSGQNTPSHIEKDSFALASYYTPPAKHSGEFLYTLSSPHSDNFFCIAGGPTTLLSSSSGDDTEQTIVPPISWTIKGIVDVFRHIFEAPHGSTRLNPRHIVQEIYRGIRDISPKNADSWSFFACFYDQSSSELLYYTVGRREPIFIQKNGLTSQPETEIFDRSSLSPPPQLSDQTHHGENRRLTIKPGDTVLLLPGGASVCKSDRHQIFHNILLRRLADADLNLSAIQMRDYLMELQVYYYQNQPLEKDLAVLVFQRLAEHPQLGDSDPPINAAS